MAKDAPHAVCRAVVSQGCFFLSPTSKCHYVKLSGPKAIVKIAALPSWALITNCRACQSYMHFHELHSRAKTCSSQSTSVRKVQKKKSVSVPLLLHQVLQLSAYLTELI